MCATLDKNRTFWNELDENITYYQNDAGYTTQQSHLRFMNVSADKSIEDLNIYPQGLRALNKYNSYLNVFIETQTSTIIARLYTNPLQMKITFRVFYEYLFNFNPIYDFKFNTLLLLQNTRLIQLRRNKLIRKYKQNHKLQLNQDIIVRMGLNSFNLYSIENWLYDYFLQSFERIFNISLLEINQKYGIHTFKKIGNFIILKKPKGYLILKSQQQCEELPVYYLSINVLLRGDGVKGMFYLAHEKTLKIIKQFNNILYAVIRFENYYQVNEVRDGQLLLLQQINRGNNLKKPILFQQHLIVTDTKKFFNPYIHHVNLNKNEQNTK